MYGAGGYDHVAVATGAGAMFLTGARFPDGLDAECFGFAALERAWKAATQASDREHVTPYIWRHKTLFRCGPPAERRRLFDTPVDRRQRRRLDAGVGDLRGVVSARASVRHGRRAATARINPALAAANGAFIGQEGYEQLWIEKE